MHEKQKYPATAQPVTDEDCQRFARWAVRYAHDNQMDYSDLEPQDVRDLAPYWWGAGWEEPTDAQCEMVVGLVKEHLADPAFDYDAQD